MSEKSLYHFHLNTCFKTPCRKSMSKCMRIEVWYRFKTRLILLCNTLTLFNDCFLYSVLCSLKCPFGNRFPILKSKRNRNTNSSVSIISLYFRILIDYRFTIKISLWKENFAKICQGTT